MATRLNFILYTDYLRIPTYIVCKNIEDRGFRGFKSVEIDIEPGYRGMYVCMQVSEVPSTP